jgi:hypothetical protein
MRSLCLASVLFVSLTASAYAKDKHDLHASFPTADNYATIQFDFTGAPDLQEWGETKVAPVLQAWYPKLIAMLPSPGFHSAKTITVEFKDIKAPAYTMGARITANPDYFRKHPNDVNALTHELTHVVQDYGPNGGGYGHNPVWLVEGLDDYIRFYVVEPETHGADIGPKRAATVNYNDSYRTTGNFLHWVVLQTDPSFIVKLNAAMRAHTYSDQTWVELTGKSATELGDEWKKSLLNMMPQG